MECARGAGREVKCYEFAHIRALRAHVWVHFSLIWCVISLCLKLMSCGVTADGLHVFHAAKVCFGFSCCAAAVHSVALGDLSCRYHAMAFAWALPLKLGCKVLFLFKTLYSSVACAQTVCFVMGCRSAGHTGMRFPALPARAP